MLVLFALAVVPGVALLSWGIASQANPRFQRVDRLIAILGFAVLLVLALGSASVVIPS
jgi:hypothetical protein